VKKWLWDCEVIFAPWLVSSPATVPSIPAGEDTSRGELAKENTSNP